MTEEMLMERGDQRFSAPRGSLRRGRLEFTRGAARLTIGGEGIPELFRARFDPPTPSVSVHEGSMTVRSPRLRIGRGVRDLTFDDQEFGAVGGRLRLESREAGGTDGRYDIEIAGGAAHVEVITEQAAQEGSTA